MRRGIAFGIALLAGACTQFGSAKQGSPDAGADREYPVSTDADGSARVDGPKPPSSLTDAFTAGAIDPFKWQIHQGTGYKVEVVTEELHISNPEPASDWGGITTRALYDLNEGEVGVNVVASGTTADLQSAAFAWLKLVAATDSSVAVEVLLYEGEIHARKSVGGVMTTLRTAAYSPTSTRWLRLREKGGRTYWEYSTSDAGPWIVLHDELDPIAMGAVSLQLGAGAWPGIVGEVAFDSLTAR
jgi:hypothetical protein